MDIHCLMRSVMKHADVVSSGNVRNTDKIYLFSKIDKQKVYCILLQVIIAI